MFPVPHQSCTGLPAATAEEAHAPRVPQGSRHPQRSCWARARRLIQPGGFPSYSPARAVGAAPRDQAQTGPLFPTREMGEVPPTPAALRCCSPSHNAVFVMRGRASAQPLKTS